MFNQTDENTNKLPVGEITTTNGTVKTQLLRDSVTRGARKYFAQFNQDEQPTEVYDLFLSEVEAPLLDVVMEFCRGNQTKAANILGINRGTLRKKLKRYGKG